MMSSRANVCRTRADPSSWPRAEEMVEEKTPAMMKGSAYATCCMMYLGSGTGRGGRKSEEEKKRRGKPC